MKFKKGDRVVVVGNLSGDAPPLGTTGTVKRPWFYTGNVVVVFDDGTGWQDNEDPGTIGWNVKEDDLQLITDDFLYDVDE